MTGSGTEHERFSAMYHELAPRVYSFVRRRVDASTAQEVVSDTFLVAWRRFAIVPEDVLPWLLVVARNTTMDHIRRSRRRDDLADKIARVERSAGHAVGADAPVLERDQMIKALAELTDLEREAVLMIAWDGLSNTQAAQVAGCSVRAFEVRLSRARARLNTAMSTSADPPGRGSPRSVPLAPTGASRTTAR